jgi:SAM-dependent methyltransferase
MAYPIADNIWNILACSYCGQTLEKTRTGAKCSGCNLIYEYSDSGPLDLHIKKPKKYILDFELGTPLFGSEDFLFQPMTANTKPQVDFSGLRIPRHLTKDILSYFPKASSRQSLMLDLGCGGAIHKQVCERAGFEWVGLDYESSKAQILGDGHSLPFNDNSFEFILCVTVLQYVRYPFVMMREAYRVLKPGGKLIGTVAFLEPSHGTSFYHHTHLGIYNSLQYGGFTVEKISPSEKWSGLIAQASMGMFPGMPRIISQSIVFPLQLFHQLWWQLGGLIRGRNLSHVRARHFTGSFTFIASRK